MPTASISLPWRAVGIFILAVQLQMTNQRSISLCPNLLTGNIQRQKISGRPLTAKELLTSKRLSRRTRSFFLSVPSIDLILSAAPISTSSYNRDGGWSAPLPVTAINTVAREYSPRLPLMENGLFSQVNVEWER